MTHPTRRNALKAICAAVAAVVAPLARSEPEWTDRRYWVSEPRNGLYGPSVLERVRHAEWADRVVHGEPERMGRVTARTHSGKVCAFLNGHDYSNVAVDGDDREGWVDCLLWEGFPNPPQPGRQFIGVNRWAALNASCEYWQPDGFPFMPEPGYKGRAYGGYVWEDERGRPHATIYGPWVFLPKDHPHVALARHIARATALFGT